MSQSVFVNVRQRNGFPYVVVARGWLAGTKVVEPVGPPRGMERGEENRETEEWDKPFSCHEQNN